MTRAVLLVLSAATIASASPAVGAPEQYELPNVLIISKSTNHNEVHYAAYVDATCAPRPGAPLHAYWLMRERGPRVTEPLSSGERRVLGVIDQVVSGDAIRFIVSGMPSRTFIAHMRRGADGTCSSWVDARIAGAEARLLGVYVKQGLFGVDQVVLSGRTPGGSIVEERVRP